MYDLNKGHGGAVIMHKHGVQHHNMDYETMHEHHMEATNPHGDLEGAGGGGGIGETEESRDESGAEYKD